MRRGWMLLGGGEGCLTRVRLVTVGSGWGGTVSAGEGTAPGEGAVGDLG